MHRPWQGTMEQPVIVSIAGANIREGTAQTIRSYCLTHMAATPIIRTRPMHKDAAQNRTPHPRCTVMKRMIAMGHRCPQASGGEVHAVARTATAIRSNCLTHVAATPIIRTRPMHKDVAQNRAPHARGTVLRPMTTMGHRHPQTLKGEARAVARTPTTIYVYFLTHMAAMSIIGTRPMHRASASNPQPHAQCPMMGCMRDMRDRHMQTRKKERGGGMKKTLVDDTTATMRMNEHASRYGQLKKRRSADPQLTQCLRQTFHIWQVVEPPPVWGGPPEECTRQTKGAGVTCRGVVVHAETHHPRKGKVSGTAPRVPSLGTALEPLRRGGRQPREVRKRGERTHTTALQGQEHMGSLVNPLCGRKSMMATASIRATRALAMVAPA